MSNISNNNNINNSYQHIATSPLSIDNGALPYHLLGLDPLSNCHLKLLIGHIHRLSLYNNEAATNSLFGHFVTKVEIVGIIISVKQRKSLREYSIDDGSGIIPCIQWEENYQNNNNNTGDNQLGENLSKCFSLGSLVRIHGVLTSYRSVKQVTVETIRCEFDPNVELLHSVDCMKLWKEYQKISDPLKAIQKKLQTPTEPVANSKDIEEKSDENKNDETMTH